MTVKYQNVWRTMNDLETVTSKICSAREILDCAIDAHQEHKYEKVEHLLNAVDEYLQYYLKDFDEKFKDAWQATVGDLRDGDVKDDGMRPWGHSDIEYQISNKKSLTCDKDDSSPECKGAWNSFWENYSSEEYQGSTVSNVVGNYIPAPDSPDKVFVGSRVPGGLGEDHITFNPPTKKSWVIPVEADPSGEYFVQFPDDLLEAANLKEGDSVEWIDQGNGSCLLKKAQPSWVEGNELAKVKSYDEMIAAGWSMTDDGFWIKE